ncbi:hypothetical protein Hanom_Chr12g01085461 [Helianthus anomalus]
MPDEEDKAHFEPIVSLDIEEFATGLGFQKEVPSDQAQSINAECSTITHDQDPLVIVEDVDSLDDESEDDEPVQSDVVSKEENIPIRNHILCDPPVKPTKTVPAESTSSQGSDNVNVLYALVGDDRIYSDKAFPIKNVNQS